MRFKHFLESTDIFGFENKIRGDEKPRDDIEDKPMRQFDVELMMDYLRRKKVGVHEASMDFVNEIQWGNSFGAIKLEVDTGFRFLVKRLGRDLEGSPVGSPSGCSN